LNRSPAGVLIRSRVTDVNQLLNQGKALMARGAFAEAADVYRRVVNAAPNFPPALANLGIALAKAGRFEEALGPLLGAAKAAQGAPQAEAIWMNVGRAYMDLNRLAESADAYGRAVKLKPDFADAHWNRGIALLKAGRFDEGWPEFEWRLRLPGRNANPVPGPRWDGTPLGGKTILLWGEQGFGDVIQFLRYAPLVASQFGGRVWVTCHPELRRLARRVEGVAEVFPPRRPIPPFDTQAALMSLGQILRTTVETVPGNVPYIPADAARVEHWRGRLADGAGAGRRLNVGVAWAGRPTHTNDVNRSITPDMLLPLSRVDGVRLVSLQKGPAAEAARAAGLPLKDFTNDLQDFADTADLIGALDAVVTVDTALAHLAGAMSKPVSLLLPFVPDWRWMLDRMDTPWYPSVQLFRQRTRGDWAGVIREVENALGNGAE
jgi:tetratricopeptide (TPR) repeat protein